MSSPVPTRTTSPGPLGPASGAMRTITRSLRLPALLPAMPARRRSPVVLLQIYVVVLFVFPTNTVLAVIGGAGFPAGLFAIAFFGLYMTWTLMGNHDPVPHRYPTRIGLGAVWVTSLVSYVVCQFNDLTPTEANGADRWLLLLAGLTGVILLASEGLVSREEIYVVLRTTVWAGAYCGLVAALQYWLRWDLAAIAGSSLPGFTFNETLGGIQMRGGLNRVPGTTQHPIELGAVAAMLLPTAITVAVTDRGRKMWQRWVPVLMILVCIPVSVSRSAILAIVVAVVVFTVQLSARRRAATMALAPFAVVGIFMAIPGVIATLSSFFVGAGTDTSVSTRTEDYPLVEEMVKQRPWFGQGGGSYVPSNMLTIFDNAYLLWVVEFGLVGLAVIVIWYLVLPIITAVTARRRAVSEEIRMLAAALSAGLAAAALSAVTFDAPAFCTFMSLQALMIGLVGAVWQEMVRERRQADLLDPGPVRI